MANNNSNNSLNKVAFWTIVVVALLYVTSIILAHFHIYLNIVHILKCVASILMVVSTSILAWRYVRNKDLVWKMLYLISIALVIFGVIIPLLPFKI